jgi:hypothetical protein
MCGFLFARRDIALIGFLIYFFFFEFWANRKLNEISIRENGFAKAEITISEGEVSARTDITKENAISQFSG